MEGQPAAAGTHSGECRWTGAVVWWDQPRDVSEAGQLRSWMVRLLGHRRGFIQGRDLALSAWETAGREGRPYLVAHCYAGVGPLALDSANRYLRDYYAHRVNDLDAIIGAVLLGSDAIGERLEEMSEAGCDEFILTPVAEDLDQVQLMADAAGL